MTEFEFLYEDNAILVVNKPAGLPVLADGYHPEAPFLAYLLKVSFGRVWVVHRLDKGTSGVMVFARSVEAHRSLNMQFDRGQVRKRYHSLVKGKPDWKEQRVDLPLRPDADRHHRTRVDPLRGKPARTDIHIVEYFVGAAFVEAIPHTGRTHQIRAHLAALGFPLIADPLYGDGQPLMASDVSFPGEPGMHRVLIGRPALHAKDLSFMHPVDGKTVEFTAKYPDDFAQALQALRSAGR